MPTSGRSCNVWQIVRLRSLGVNSDPLEKVQEALERENITWRSFSNGGSTRGPDLAGLGCDGRGPRSMCWITRE